MSFETATVSNPVEWLMRTLITKACETCGEEFSKPPSQMGRFCSKPCFYKSLEGKPSWNKGLQGDPRMKGNRSPRTPEYRAKISATRKARGYGGVKSHNWKGDEVGYYSLHMWVRRNFDEPAECEICGKRPPSPCEHCGRGEAPFHWAQLSKKVSRERADWAWACRPCHWRLDNGV